jgi:hypothetical protein
MRLSNDLHPYSVIRERPVSRARPTLFRARLANARQNRI